MNSKMCKNLRKVAKVIEPNNPYRQRLIYKDLKRKHEKELKARKVH